MIVATCIVVRIVPNLHVQNPCAEPVLNTNQVDVAGWQMHSARNILETVYDKK